MMTRFSSTTIDSDHDWVAAAQLGDADHILADLPSIRRIVGPPRIRRDISGFAMLTFTSLLAAALLFAFNAELHAIIVAH